MKKSELRQDVVSGDWIIVAPGRSKRPHESAIRLVKRKKAPIKECPFEDPQAAGNRPAILAYPSAKDWQIQVLENKYPAVRHEKVCGSLAKSGPYSVLPAVGHHDLIITRDHHKNFAKLSEDEAVQVFQVFRDRYLMLYNDPCIAYTLFFHNWGPTAGASVYHPHYQMLAMPIVPPDVNHSLQGSARYQKENKKCVHCEMIAWELKDKKRVVFENEGAIAFAPFVSRLPFEVRIFPKKHLAYFENSYDEDIAYVVGALQHVLKRLEHKLKDPDYNFFIHTAPIKDKEKYDHYHWHIEVYPKVSIQAAFEQGSGVELNSVDPNDAAKFLR